MTSISLKKNQGISLRKEAPSVSKFYLAMGWDEYILPNGKAVDPDVSAFLCKTNASGDPILYPNGDATDQSERDYGNLVFFNNARSRSDNGAVIHVYGDNRNGKNAAARRGTPMEHDDEAITVDTAILHPEIDEISFVATIDDCAAQGLDFSKAKNSFIRICENDGYGREIARFKLDESFALFTAIQFGSLIKAADGSWSFEAVGKGYGSLRNVVDFEAVVGQYANA